MDRPTREYVYVIGAGASVDLEFPTGDKLRESVSSLLTVQDRPYPDMLSLCSTKEINQTLKALFKYQWEITRSKFL